MSWKTILTGVALGGALLFGGVQAAQARDCFERIRQEQFKLERDIARHGVFSRQAEHRRRTISQLRERCFFQQRHGRWWDNRWDRRHRWGGRDWDDDDRGGRWGRRERDERWEKHNRGQRWRRRSDDHR